MDKTLRNASVPAILYTRRLHKFCLYERSKSEKKTKNILMTHLYTISDVFKLVHFQKKKKN